jgi:putative endonuclease
MNRTYCVYFLASRSRNLYTGITGNREHRMAEHRQGLVPGFTTRYRIFRLVYFEFFTDIRAVIAREKEIKAWRREKKIWLIKRSNPTWADLAEKISHQCQNATSKADPSPPVRQNQATGLGMTKQNLRSRREWSDDENGIAAVQRRCRAGSRHRSVDERALR